MKDTELVRLQLHAQHARRNVIQMIKAGKSGHMGGALSCIDIVTALYFNIMKIDPKSPKDPNRDRFVLSAGHKCMAQYAVLAQRGFFDKGILDTYGSLDTVLPGHPNMHELPGIEANTGALGHGLSISVGMALGLRLDKNNARVFVITGDGELPEGSNWEAIAAAAHYKLSNLIAIVDSNELQISGKTNEIMNMDPIGKRFESFGWNVIDIDGNNMEEVLKALINTPIAEEKPTAIIAHTVKAKGLSFAEKKVAYHYWTPDQLELSQAFEEIDDSIHNLQRRFQNES
jgi:transketolase